MKRIIALIFTLGVAAAPVWAAELQPHRATFGMSLMPGGPVTGILGVIGRMGIEFEAACDGYVSRQALQMAIRDAQGGVTESRYSSLTWESADGREMTFETAGAYGNQADPPYAGRARLGDPAAPGRATYDVPEGRTVTFSAATVFPAEHVRKLLDSAAAGERMVTQDVFEGGSPQNYTTIISSIGEPLPPDSALPVLAARKSWMVREAHFRPGSRGETPEFEVGFRLYEGGLIDTLDLDYGPFRVTGKLTAVELLPPPRC